MLSQLFADDPVLAAVAVDQDRISRTQHADDPAVRKVQFALLAWDPGCLPRFGADGQYGDETAGAVAQFKRTVLDVPDGELVDDVGPRTVVRLDQMTAVDEAQVDLGVAMIAADPASLLAARDAVEQAGGRVLFGIGDTAAIAAGDGVGIAWGLVGDTLTAVVDPRTPTLPDGIAPDVADGLSAWLAMFDSDYLLAQLDPGRFDDPGPSLGGCTGTGER